MTKLLFCDALLICCADEMEKYSLENTIAFRLSFLLIMFLYILILLMVYIPISN
jgi:hypothetical protein